MTTGLYTAATLSIDINTSNAVTNLAALEARYGALLTALAGASGKATGPMQALATSIAEINAKAAETEKTAGAFTKLSGAIKGASDGIARSVKSSSGVVDTLNAKLQMTSRLVSRLNAEKLDLNLGASVNQSKAISLMNAKLASAFGQIEATGGGNTLASLEAAMRKQSELSEALASYRGESAAREAEELASQKRRFQAELKAVKDRQAAESSYTAWWASELKKREAEQMQSAIRSANMTSKLTSRLSAERLDLQLGSSATQSKASSLMNAKLASAFGQIEATGGGNTLAALEASSKKSHEAMLAVANTTSAVATNYKKLTPAVHDATKAHDKFNSTLSDTHAFARGVSGSLGALWMTYGQVAPLLAGAAIGAAFKSSMGKGSEFEFQLTFVKALGEESAEAVGRLRDTALSLGENSLFGPVQLASGLRILAQAGLTADQSIAALRDTTDLATVGEMEMGEAAVTLVGVLNAFKLSKTDFSRVGDVFAKAAAMSQSSVADMTNAMRTASVVGEQYGVSLEDTAAALTLLAQVNVKGTAAGTSFRNMMKELYSPVPQAAAMMKKLGLETADATGSLRPMADVVYDLKGKLEGFNKVSQVEILQKLFGERGAKEAIAMLSLTRDEWDKLVDSIGNADGFMRNVAAQLEATTKGVFIQAKNALEGGLVEAFERTDGAAHELAVTLRTLFVSKEFKDGLAVLVDGLAQLAKIAVAVAPAVAALGSAWVAFRLLAPVNAAFATGVVAVNSALGALANVFVSAAFSILLGGGITAAFAGMVTSMKAVAVAAWAMLGPFGKIALVAAGVYYAYRQIVGETPAAVIAANKYAEAMEFEAERIEQTNKSLKEQIRLKKQNGTVDTSMFEGQLASIDARILDAGLRKVDASKRARSDISALVDYSRINTEIEDLKAARARVVEAFGDALVSSRAEFNNRVELGSMGMKDDLEKLKEAAVAAGKPLDKLLTIEGRINSAANRKLSRQARQSLLDQAQEDLQAYRLNTLNSGTNVLGKDGAASRFTRPYIDIIPELKNSLQKLEGEYSSGQGKIAESIRDGSKDIDLAFQQSEELLRSNFTSQLNELSSARTKIEKELTGGARKKALDQLAAAEIAAQRKHDDELAKLHTDASAERRSLADSEVAFEIFIGKRMQSVREQAFIEFDQKAKRQYDQAKAIISNATLHTTDVVEAAKKKLEDIALARSVYGDIAEAKTRGEQLAADVDATMSELRAKYENADKYGIFGIFGTFQQAEAWKRDNLDRLAADIATQREKIATIRASGGSSEQLRDAEIKLRDTQVKFDELSKTIPKTVEKWGDDLGTYFAEGIVYGFKEGEKPLQKFKSMLKRSVTDGIAEALSKQFKVSIMNMMGGSSNAGGAGGGGGNLLGNLTSSAGSSLIGEGLLSLGSSAALGGTSLGGFATGAGAAMVNGAGFMGNMAAAGSLIGTGTAGGIATGMGMGLATAAPYVLAAYVIADAAGLFGKRGGPQQGQYGDISASGYKASYTMSGGDALGNQALAQSAYDQVAALYGMAGKQVSDLVIGQGYKLDPEGSASGVAYRNINIGGKTVSGGTFDGNNGAQWRGGNSDGAGAAAYLGKLTSDEIKKLVDVIGDSGLSTTIEKLSANFSDLADGIAKYAVAQATQKSLLRILMSDEEVRAQDLADANKLIKNSFDALGLALPTSTEGFRELVSGLDLTSLSGQNTLTKLAGVAEAFKLVADEAERTSQTRAGWQMKLDVLQGKYTQMQLDRFLELAGVSDEATKAIMQQVYALEDQQVAASAAADAAKSAADAANTAAESLRNMQAATLEGVNAAVDGLRSAYQAEIDEKDRLVERMRAQVQKIRDFSQSLALGNLSTLDPLAKYNAASAQYEDVSRRAALGDQDAVDQYQTVAQAFLQTSRDYNASSARYAADYARVMASNDRIIGMGERQAVVMASQADATRAQLSALGTINASVNTVTSAIDRLQSAVLEAVRAGNVGSVSDSAKNAAGLITGRAGETYNALTDTWTNKTGTRSGTSGDIKAWATDILSSIGEMALYTTAKEVGLSMPSLDTIMGWSAGTTEDWAKKNNLASFDVGTDYVPRTGLALIHKGEAITPAAQNRRGANDGGDQQTAQAIREGNGISRQGFSLLADKLDRMERRLAGLENDARLRGAA